MLGFAGHCALPHQPASDRLVGPEAAVAARQAAQPDPSSPPCPARAHTRPLEHGCPRVHHVCPLHVARSAAGRGAAKGRRRLKPRARVQVGRGLRRQPRVCGASGRARGRRHRQAGGRCARAFVALLPWGRAEARGACGQLGVKQADGARELSLRAFVSLLWRETVGAVPEATAITSDGSTSCKAQHARARQHQGT